MQKVLVTITMWISIIVLCIILAKSDILSGAGAGIMIFGALFVTLFIWCGQFVVSIVREILDWMV